MKKITKKELKKTIETAINNVLKKFDLAGTSKKTKKAIAKVAKTLKTDLKEKTKKASKKELVKAKTPKKNKTKKNKSKKKVAPTTGTNSASGQNQ